MGSRIIKTVNIFYETENCIISYYTGELYGTCYKVLFKIYDVSTGEIIKRGIIDTLPGDEPEDIALVCNGSLDANWYFVQDDELQFLLGK